MYIIILIITITTQGTTGGVAINVSQIGKYSSVSECTQIATQLKTSRAEGFANISQNAHCVYIGK